MPATFSLHKLTSNTDSALGQAAEINKMVPCVLQRIQRKHSWSGQRRQALKQTFGYTALKKNQEARFCPYYTT